MALSEFFFSAGIGLGVGLVSTILGLGGGIVVVPLLPLVAHVSARETIGTSLLTIFFVSMINVWRFHQRRQVVWLAALLIGVFAAAGSYVSAILTGFVSVFVLHATMACVLGLIAFFSLAPNGFGGGFQLPSRTGLQRNLTSALIGWGSGLISGFTGVGGGVLITPLLGKLKGVAATRIVPTANAAMLLTSAAGAFGFFRSGLARGEGGVFGLVRVDLALALFLGAQITAPFGRRLQADFSPRLRNALIGVLLVGFAGRTLLLAIRELGGG